MEKIFIKRLIIMMASCMLLLLLLGYYFIKTSVLQNFEDTSIVKINQVLQILSQNENEIETLNAASHEDYLSRARAVAYIIETNPKVVDNTQELFNIAKLMQIDELHIFDENGVIIAGTVFDYVGVGVEDGTQIGYFKQILEDPSLELVQDITPATADGRLMQYSAVSRKDKKGIVQIGMLPIRMLEILRRNEVSHVLAAMITDMNEVICVINNETGAIKGIAIHHKNKSNFNDMEFTRKIVESAENGKYVKFFDSDYLALALKTNYGIIYVAKNKDSIMEPVKENVLFLAISLILIATLMIIVIKRLLERHVIYGIEEIINSLRKITDGDLNTIVSVENNPEFMELSYQINTMVDSLLHSTSKISKIIDSLNVNIGIYEYKNDMKKVVVTNRLASILSLNADEAKKLFEDKFLFEEKISLIFNGVQDQEDKMIYCILSAENNKYVKIKTFNDFNTTMGIVIDVTEDIIRRNVIIHDRDYDVLSELYNRRAFMRETDFLFNNAEELKISCIMMFDMDNLKYVNDVYGHHNGDKYIRAGADVLRKSQLNEKCVISRLGGDEFAIMWYGYDTQEQIIKNIENIYEVMMKTTIAINEHQKQPVKFSGGYAFYPEHSREKSVLLKLSDKALYTAKHNDKSKFMRYKPNYS